MSLRSHFGYVAFGFHRISGLCLAIFLPVHLFVLANLLDKPATVDQFLTWTQTPLVKILESILILLAAVHLSGGIRIVLYEWFAVDGRHNLWISVTLGLSILCATVFLING